MTPGEKKQMASLNDWAKKMASTMDTMLEFRSFLEDDGFALLAQEFHQSHLDRLQDAIGMVLRGCKLVRIGLWEIVYDYNAGPVLASYREALRRKLDPHSKELEELLDGF